MEYKSEVKILDDKGRLSISKNLREALQFESGDVLKIQVKDGGLLVRKVGILDYEGSSDKEIMSNIQNAFNSLSKSKKISLVKKIIKMIEGV
ncbi:SpoVT/AbrB domain-containing protein [Erysipelothrix rhusiopathiae SY1027]|uniref:AbrB/MazE/SpoVT family DNA-binding domain-containing protein n=1 Tax=Erysipelothrix rhusiopathiae TaxID=1648 RepID=UPI0003348F54|nr:AbrB/MazE/SpoVT family DNA-binding domain-containing protein [Erysipelothrix rhusiopathiae]AGN24539.1 SpoVT/AbrB domain-containing protein [Erysipelothrix rhusiopathiae SY1027]